MRSLDSGYYGVLKMFEFLLSLPYCGLYAIMEHRSTLATVPSGVVSSQWADAIRLNFAQLRMELVRRERPGLYMLGID